MIKIGLIVAEISTFEVRKKAFILENVVHSDLIARHSDCGTAKRSLLKGINWDLGQVYIFITLEPFEICSIFLVHYSNFIR